MLSSSIRCLAVFSLVCVLSLSVSAQQAGGGNTAVGGGTGGAGTDNSQGTGAMTSLDPDTVFSNVERSDTVGGTTRTVGREEDAGAAGARAGGFGGGGIGGFGGLGGLGSLFGGFGAGSSAASKPAIRTRLRSVVDTAPLQPQQVQLNAARRFGSLTNRQSLRGINVEMRDRTAVISGVVSSARDRRMSELLLRLEPGVASVENQVVVSPPSPGDR